MVNGPYKLTRYVTSQRVIFSKNPYYWEKGPNGESLPYIPRVVWAIVESTDTSLLQFRSGSLDSLGVPPESFSLLKQEEERGNFVIYNGGPTYASSYLTFNLNQGKRQGKPLVDPIKSRWFNNLNFRQAIAYGIDRERMVNNIYRGLGEKQNSFIPVQSPFFNPDVKVYNYDPEKAQALLKAGALPTTINGNYWMIGVTVSALCLIPMLAIKCGKPWGPKFKKIWENLAFKWTLAPLVLACWWTN
ncbi:ABC transporter substrate-binding protein [Synechocystis sp. B12]|nr:ABC transporter substrate-binding protein [Synechocystis sp. B12]